MSIDTAHETVRQKAGGRRAEGFPHEARSRARAGRAPWSSSVVRILALSDAQLPRAHAHCSATASAVASGG